MQITEQINKSQFDKTGTRGFLYRAFHHCYFTTVAMALIFFCLEILVFKTTPVSDLELTLQDSKYIKPGKTPTTLQAFW